MEIIDDSKANHVTVIAFCERNDIVKVGYWNALPPAEEQASAKIYS